MLVPIKWMSQYVDINVDDKELADKLTLTGSHVDSIIDTDKNVTNVVTGKILKIEKHPEADKLVVTQVDVGTETRQIVTGANNISVGDIVPIALDGAKLPDGTTIKPSKLRGIPSNGMMCSYGELGFDDKVIPKNMQDGIAILEPNTEIGVDIKKALMIGGKVLDIEITYNRPDCLNITGMARETAATLKTEFKFPEIEIKNEVDDIKDYLNSVDIEADDLCERFYAKVIKDIKIEPSPLWMQRTLMDAGMRPINNIVDITNYVMLELGQPLHAYDLEKIEDRKIVVRRPLNGEKLTTIDSVERKLEENMLVIADGKKASCIAGVMGGLDSEITPDTKVMLLEAATFNSKSIRETSKKLGLRSEASARNEKAMSFVNAEIASRRACQLIEMIGAGTVVKGYIDAGKSEYVAPTVTLRPYRADNLLGVHIPVERMLEILNTLSLESTFDGEKITSKVPYYRCDIEQEADLIEEVGRMYGLENIESKPLISEIQKGRKSDKRETEDYIRRIMVAMGLYEVMTYSFISPKSYDKICAQDGTEIKNYIKLINPLGEDYSVMRTTLMTNMLDIVTRNINRGIKQATLFEVGNTFIPKDVNHAGVADERSKLCIAMYGDYDFFNLKGIIEQTLERLGIKLNVKHVRDNATFHGGRCAGIYVNDDMIGIFGEIHHNVLNNYGLDNRVLMAEIDVEKLVKYKHMERKYVELPKYPAMQRDIAIKVKEEVLVGDMEDVIRNTDPSIIEDVKLFDVYKGEHIEKGYKSTAFSITYRNKNHTMKDKEVDKLHELVLKNLQDKFDAVLR